jgi:glycine/D-amino acid oxidase-like deaminating enzyme/nitrite reductase/ring-hydroxylating ferredoxin subunit
MSTDSIWLPRATFDPPTTTSLPAQSDVVVLGAGIAGMAAATRLARVGLDVVVLDAATAASGTTGHSSAKVSLVHGLNAHRIAARDGLETAVDYLTANRLGLDWIAEQVDSLSIDCGWQRRPGITYVTDPRNDAAVGREIDVMTSAGIAASRVELELPYPTSAAVSVADQAQFDPVRFVRGLVSDFEANGGSLIEGCRATRVDQRSSGAVVRTSMGDVHADWVVVATGLPFLDRGAMFARAEPKSSYVIACDVDRLPADGMYLSADGPTRSLRTAPIGDRTVLLVGGEGHKTGQGGDTRLRYDTLTEWADAHFGVVEVLHRFSAHDYTTADLRPFVGPLVPGRRRVLVATGFNKWGFTNAAAGAAVLEATITGAPMPDWAHVFSTARIPVSGFATLVSANLDVGAHMIGGWVDGLRSHRRPMAGEGRVTRRGARPVAVSVEDDNTVCSVSGYCTHLGGIVAWNPADRTWDCPLHGSRFGRDGTMHHGPAVADLAPSDPPVGPCSTGPRDVTSPE